jgi:hypothetical protein
MRTSKKRQQTEQGANDEAESSERPCRPPEMLSTVAARVDRVNVARKPLDMKKGKKFNVHAFGRKEADHRELHGFSNFGNQLPTTSRMERQLEDGLHWP